MRPAKSRRKPGTGVVHRISARRYEVRASQVNGEVGEIVAVCETRFRAEQAADAWYAAQCGKEKQCTTA